MEWGYYITATWIWFVCSAATIVTTIMLARICWDLSAELNSIRNLTRDLRDFLETEKRKASE